MRHSRGLLAAAVLFGAAGPLRAQGGPYPPDLRAYLDCTLSACDFDLFRTELGWVSWMRERTGAHVHLLVTARPSAGGGQQHTVRFVGAGPFDRRNDELVFSAPATATEDAERRGLLRTISLGLVGYAARGGAGGRLVVTESQAPSAAPAAGGADPWRAWVFRIGTTADLSGESSRSSNTFGATLRAARTTPLWKWRFIVRNTHRTDRVEFDDGRVFRAVSDVIHGSALAVRSLGRHWSVGLGTAARHSNPQNLQSGVKLAPGIEYNVFPYDEATKRQLTFLYDVSFNRFVYQDTTIFGKLRETFSEQNLAVALTAIEPWGSSRLTVEGATDLVDFSKNVAAVSGELAIRVARGLDLRVETSYSRIRNQRYLPKAGASDEEVLLRLKSLRTSYSYAMLLGLTYTFGSIFNTIVNPRFGGSLYGDGS